MTEKTRLIAVRLDAELAEAVEAKQAAHGTPVSEQVRRALRAWLESEGFIGKADRKRAPTRKRS